MNEIQDNKRKELTCYLLKTCVGIFLPLIALAFVPINIKNLLPGIFFLILMTIVSTPFRSIQIKTLIISLMIGLLVRSLTFAPILCLQLFNIERPAEMPLIALFIDIISLSGVFFLLYWVVSYSKWHWIKLVYSPIDLGLLTAAAACGMMIIAPEFSALEPITSPWLQSAFFAQSSEGKVFIGSTPVGFGFILGSFFSILCLLTTKKIRSKLFFTLSGILLIVHLLIGTFIQNSLDGFVGFTNFLFIASISIMYIACIAIFLISKKSTSKFLIEENSESTFDWKKILQKRRLINSLFFYSFMHNRLPQYSKFISELLIKETWNNSMTKLNKNYNNPN